MPSTRKPKSVLQTPDPYHTPGYGGFCPQFQYQIGETFGRTTSRLLTDSNVAKSGRPVLAEIEVDCKKSAADNAKRINALRTRQRSLGDQKLTDDMIPGYSGYIPKSLNYFGSRFTEICRDSVADFEQDYKCHDAKIQGLRYSSTQTGLTPRITPRHCPPNLNVNGATLDAVRDQHLPYLSPNVKPNLPSPYYMRNTDPNKKFMSGYQGFVPRSRGLMGLGYPIITNKALITFADETEKHQELKDQPILVKRVLQSARDPDEKPIYPVGVGMIPDYTGHIPGQKFRYGKTFGSSTENVKIRTSCVSAR